MIKKPRIMSISGQASPLQTRYSKTTGECGLFQISRYPNKSDAKCACEVKSTTYMSKVALKKKKKKKKTNSPTN